MENNNYANIIGSKRFKTATNSNTNLQVELTNNQKPLNEYDFIEIVDQETVFQEEREASKKYRINGKLSIYTSNELTTGATTNYWDPLFYGYGRNNFKPSPANWVMQILYPVEKNYDLIVGNAEAYRGLDYLTIGSTLINNDQKYTISGQQKHNLNIGDFIYLYSNNNINPIQGFHEVLELGIENKNLTTDITLNTISSGPIIGSGSFLRVVNVSFDDVAFNNAANIVNIAATDISGSTTGSYLPGETKYTMVTTNGPHNLLKNNFVDIRVPIVNKINGLWRVYNIISPNKFIIRLNCSNTKGQLIGFSQTPKWRKLDATPSEYYVRSFEVLTTNDYDVYPCAFAETIYKTGVINETFLFQFNQDINVKKLLNHNNAEISELYYGIIKRSGDKPYPWGNVTSHWDFNRNTANSTNFIERISKARNNTIGTIEKLSARTETIINNEVVTFPGSKYIGDFIEYNSLEITEKISAEVINRIALVNSVDGYYYKPFKRLEIRKYSNVIEYAQPNEAVINLPADFVTYTDGTIAWRDLLPIGFYQDFTNGVEYPFLNDAHYFYFNHNLFVRRQNPVNIVTPTEDINIDPNNLNVEC